MDDGGLHKRHMQADNDRGMIRGENVGKECDLGKLDLDFLLQN